MTKKRTEYSGSFKAEAIAKIKENKDNISQTAKKLGIPMNTLANWHRKAESGVLAGRLYLMALFNAWHTKSAAIRLFKA